jgi:hemoglobin
MSPTPVPKFDITAEEIDRLVAAFYDRVRSHPGLGPVFARAIAAEDGPEWRVHEAKIAGFWRNAVGIDRSYDGNPTKVHVENTDVRPGMFDPWLGLFRIVAEAELEPEKAAKMVALAERIGAGLRYSVTTRGQEKGAPPILS